MDDTESNAEPRDEMRADEIPPEVEHTADINATLARLERLISPVVGTGKDAIRAVGDRARPAWREVTDVESRVAVSVAMAIAIVLLAILPSRVANHPRWLIPGLAALLLVIVIVVNPIRVDARARRLRPIAFALLAVVSLGNAVSAGRLIVDLVNASGIRRPETLLLTGAAIWATNMIVFAVWYWEFDRGGPAARAEARDPYPDFLFPQMSEAQFAPPGWEPNFVDYLYLSFTNATAFSPTDTMPLATWAKLTMLGQAAVSILTLALVIARAVNILR